MFKNDESGFTLLEVILLISIIGILGTIYIPKTNIIKDYKASLAVEQVKKDLEKYRNLALIEGKVYMLYIDKDNNKYTIRSNIDGVVKNNLERDLTGVLTIGENNIYNSLRFNRTGIANKSGYLYFRNGDISYKVTITPVTSQINVKKEKYER